MGNKFKIGDEVVVTAYPSAGFNFGYVKEWIRTNTVIKIINIIPRVQYPYRAGIGYDSEVFKESELSFAVKQKRIHSWVLK